MDNKYSVIVVGAGHAGCEAALACSRMGVDTLLITFSKDKIGYTSCNPSIGGIGKGQLVKEIDALGGEMAKATDASCIQFRMLNSSKGYAARSSRAQIDRKLYNVYMKDVVCNQINLDVLEDEVIELITEKESIVGVKTKNKDIIKSIVVVLTTGTYMNGIIHIGLEHYSAGRFNEPASKALSENLKNLGLNIRSFKTGTPARIAGKTIDFSVMEKQEADKCIIPFSFSTKKINLPQKPCYITRTNEKTHDIIRSSLDRSPLYSGKIKSTGVRYCPSIEDKIIRFKERDSHIVFIEPEALDIDEYYPNGISTSLPIDVQEKMIHSIKGLEKAKMTQPAYGIEYDFVDPMQLFSTLETKKIQGLFIAGQVNGTTGYEEAAALGLIAGINAAKKIKKQDSLILSRSQAYIGVLIDDLVTKGTNEPYRMFTSRVEHRIVIREDNADTRLCYIGYDLGLVSKDRLFFVEEKNNIVSLVKKELKKTKLNKEKVTELLLNKSNRILKENKTLFELLKQAEICYDDLLEIEPNLQKLSYYQKVQLEVDIKYMGYINRENVKIKKFLDLENIFLPKDIDYFKIEGLSNEIKEKLSFFKPVSLAQASRISGITPAAITILMVRLKKNNIK